MAQEDTKTPDNTPDSPPKINDANRQEFADAIDALLDKYNIQNAPAMFFILDGAHAYALFAGCARCALNEIAVMAPKLAGADHLYTETSGCLYKNVEEAREDMMRQMVQALEDFKQVSSEVSQHVAIEDMKES